jgi:DNA-binding XRE family transcriptional regulator
MAKVKEDNQPWRVDILKKAAKQIAKQPTHPIDILSEFFAFHAALESNGPEQHAYANYGKLQNQPKGEEWHRCHLNRKIKNMLPAYVVVWYANREERTLEINHVDTHEKTDYERFRKKSKADGLAEIKLSLLAPTAKIKTVVNALESFAAFVPPFDAKLIKGDRRKLPESWYLKFKNKGHEIRVVSIEDETALNVETGIKASSIDNSSLSGAEPKKRASVELEPKRFNTFGEEVVSLKDIFPNKHPGMVLKGFRQRDNMTQQQLADLPKIRQSRVCDLENGARAISKSMAERLAKVFQVSRRAFL